MSLKFFFQTTLLILIVIIIIAFYLTFIAEKDKKLVKIDESEKKNNVSMESETSSELINIEYNSSDKNGNTFYINSRKATIGSDDNLDDQVNMENVVAIINLKDKGIINIKSKYATYSRMNHNTQFSSNVEISYIGNTIYSNNLDVSFSENKSSIYNDVIFKNNNMELYTDMIFLDMINGDINFKMNKETERVKLITTYEYVN